MTGNALPPKAGQLVPPGSVLDIGEAPYLPELEPFLMKGWHPPPVPPLAHGKYLQAARALPKTPSFFGCALYSSCRLEEHVV